MVMALLMAASGAHAGGVLFNDGQLDTGFGDYNGFELTPFDQGGSAFGNDDVAYGIARLPDGRLLLAGTIRTQSGNGDHWAVGLARLNANGTPDDTFAPVGHYLGAGKAIYRGNLTTNVGCSPDCDIYAFAVGLAPNGQIYLAGQVVLNGVVSGLVLHFDGDGNVIGSVTRVDQSYFNSIAINGDGSEIYVCGGRIQNSFMDFDFFMQVYDNGLNQTYQDTAHFDQGGSLNDFGRRIVYFRLPADCSGQICAYPTDNLVMAGSVARADFPDGFANTDVGLIWYTRAIPNGTWVRRNGFAPLLDFTSSTLSESQDEPRALMVTGRGDIVVAGESYVRVSNPTTADASVFFVAKLKTDGSLDQTFGDTLSTPGFLTDGFVYRYAYAGIYEGAWLLREQADGRIVLGGYGGTTEASNAPADMGFTRLHANGSFDLGFGYGGSILISLDGIGGFPPGRNEYATAGVLVPGGIVATGTRQYQGDDYDFMTVRLLDNDLIFADDNDRITEAVSP